MSLSILTNHQPHINKGMIKITCKGENDITHDIQIKMDKYGNAYLDTSGINQTYFTEFNYKLYQINIDNNNTPYAEPYKLNNSDDNLNNLIDDTIKFHDISLLKKHIVDEFEYLDKINEGYVEENNEYFIEDENSDEQNQCLINEDIVNKYGDDNWEFDFSSSTKLDTSIIKIEDECISSLYDTYIYDNQDLIFCSTSKYSNSIYKITIKDNKIYLRPVGYTEKAYIIMINKIGTIDFILTC